jgi:hypothetical protein
MIAADPNSPTGDTLLGGAGNDRFFLLGPQFHYIDGGTSPGDFDVIEMGSLLAFPQIYDFTNNTDVHNIESIKLLDTGGGIGATLTLGLSDVFSMTDGIGGTFSGNDLIITSSLSGGYLSRVNLSLDGWTIDATSTPGVGLGLTNVAAGSVTVNAMQNGQTVTLVIQPGTGSAIDLNITN